MFPPRTEQSDAEINEAMTIFERQLAEVETWVYETWAELIDWCFLEERFEESTWSTTSEDDDFACVVCCTRAASLEYGDLCSSCFLDAN